jgi:hypothetical protein
MGPTRLDAVNLAAFGGKKININKIIRVRKINENRSCSRDKLYVSYL